ncbi:MAG: helix-turn-helix transcriptional regulator [Blastococcus sp.]
MTRTVSRDAAMLPPLTLTPEQAAAIAVALAAQPDGPYAADGRTALDKVLAALEPDPRRRQSLVASTSLVRSAAGHAAGVQSVVEQGLAEHRVVVLHYRDGAGAATWREVEPQLLARTADHEYLVAWCRERAAIRWFRLDRIDDARPTTDPAPRRGPLPFGPPPAGDHPTHPAGRALGRRPAPSGRRLVLLPGGRT